MSVSLYKCHECHEISVRLCIFIPTATVPVEEHTPDPYEIPNSVRVGTTARSVKRASDDNGLPARQRIAIVLMRHPSELKLVYTVPWEEDTIPTTLQETDDWAYLVTQVGSYIIAERNKNRGKGAVKPFVVQVSEMVDPLASGGKVRYACFA